MKYIRQFVIILFISFIGEALKYVLPLPIPASIYGLVLMFVLLETKVLKVEAVQDAGKFLIEIMPMMFIPAAVGLVTSYDILRPRLLAYGVITIGTTFLVMAVSGWVTQAMLNRKKEEKTHE